MVMVNTAQVEVGTRRFKLVCFVYNLILGLWFLFVIYFDSGWSKRDLVNRINLIQ